MFDDRHFAKNLPGAELGESAANIGTDKAGDFYAPGPYKINTITRGAFLKYFRAGGELSFLSDEPLFLQFFRVEIMKQGDGFESGHKTNLLKKGFA